MPVQVFAIDPDVWKSVDDDPHCQFAVWDIWENRENHLKYAIALDNGEVEAEYVELLASNATPNQTRKILNDIFAQRDRSSRILTVQPDISVELFSEIIRHHCETPVEPALIGIAASADSTITLLLVGTNFVRRRGLHETHTQKELRRFFRNRLRRSFDITVASAIRLPGRREDIGAYQRREFENQTRLILMQRVYAKFGVMPCFERKTPGQVFNYRDSNGILAAEVDSYLFLDQNGIRFAWISECELKEEGNEGQPTTDTKIEKLARRVDAVNVFERTRTNSVIEVKGYFVTNAEFPHPLAEEIVKAKGLQFISVNMPRDWTTNTHWMLQDQDFPNCIL